VAYQIGVFIGSLAKASINRKLANAVMRLAPETMHFFEISIRDLPLYSYDYDADYPPVAREFKEAIARADALLFVTPEYNRSIPGALKNAIDWGSRPWGQNAFAGKPAAVIGCSIGAVGSGIGQQHLRTILSYLDVVQMGQPEVFIHFKPDLVTDEGEITVQSTEEFLKKWMKTYETFVDTILRAKGLA